MWSSAGLSDSLLYPEMVVSLNKGTPRIPLILGNPQTCSWLAVHRGTFCFGRGIPLRSFLACWLLQPQSQCSSQRCFTLQALSSFHKQEIPIYTPRCYYSPVDGSPQNDTSKFGKPYNPYVLPISSFEARVVLRNLPFTTWGWHSLGKSGKASCLSVEVWAPDMCCRALRLFKGIPGTLQGIRAYIYIYIKPKPN